MEDFPRVDLLGYLTTVALKSVQGVKKKKAKNQTGAVLAHKAVSFSTGFV